MEVRCVANRARCLRLFQPANVLKLFHYKSTLTFPLYTTMRFVKCCQSFRFYRRSIELLPHKHKVVVNVVVISIIRMHNKHVARRSSVWWVGVRFSPNSAYPHCIPWVVWSVLWSVLCVRQVGRTMYTIYGRKGSHRLISYKLRASLFLLSELYPNSIIIETLGTYIYVGNLVYVYVFRMRLVR